MKERVLRFRSFWIFPLLSILILEAGRRLEPESRLSDLVWLWLGGILSWTLLEYGFHRLLLHGEIRNPTLRGFISASHIGHHRAPRDPKQILVKPSFGIVISTMVLAILYAVTWSPFKTAGLMVGIWSGFLYYEAVHYRVHMSLRNSHLLQHQRRAHFHHHFSNSQRCFGVTSPLWDYVFGTKG